MTTTEPDAKRNSNTIKDLYSTKYRKVPVDYELFYNQTENILFDMMEVFAQRSAEADGSYDLSKHYEYVWDLMNAGENSIIAALEAANPAFASTFEAFKEQISKDYIEHLKQGHGVTGEDYKKHLEQVDQILGKNNKLLMVAHSQGNLFANYSYGYINSKPEYNAENAKIIRVAPASTPKASEDLKIKNDRYMLADTDLIIKALNVIPSPEGVYESNLELSIITSLRDDFNLEFHRT